MNLAESITLYITKRQAAGEKYYSPARVLRALSRSHGEIELASLTSDQVSCFLAGPRTGPATWRNKYGTLRVFFEHWLLREELHTVPLPPPAPKYTSSFVPYIYSVSELRLLLAAVPRCQQRDACLMSAPMFRTLLLLLYGTGMRIGEVLRLRGDDVDLGAGVITVRGTKFYKSRLVPLGPHVQAHLRSYLALPGRIDRNHQPLFQSRLHKAVRCQVVEIGFRRLCNLAGVRREDASLYQPRIHDLRHTFAVHRLTEWYQNGADVQLLLPVLSIYLGHVELHSTQRYLTMTPELLGEANRRFERYVCGGGDEQETER
ncbi:Mobile element protein [Acidisarcina polymorpha]|uniref:Mobile element protein n=1 Tax=Acidisarcina polymorpha TaxID=2211140 RepID=A0A2Z5GA61_9BACT|nr:tyrosine-type recombinase/integrase [Acidisarcina polymorpha]AXC15594.1 Mobile element protein [Acidisarcina polymorpha]